MDANNREEKNERAELGRARRAQLGNSGEIARRVGAVAPDVARFIEEFAYGDIHARPGLGAKERQLVIMSCIATLGHGPVELESHIDMALNLGWSRTEVTEVFIQLLVYAGFPTAINALLVAQKVFERRDAQGMDN